ncbi:MAG: hypothetical protein ACOYOS_04440 [Syntrophales bacterium]
MSQMTTLARVHERVETMSRNHTDKYIKVKDISFENLDTIRFGGDDHILRPIAQQSIANRLGIPIQYLRKCPQDIQALNMNHWIRHETHEELLFRFDGNDVRAVFTPRYIPTDNLEVLQEIEALNYDPDTRVQCSLDEEFMSLSIPDGKQTFDINGEKMTPGISVSNSEVGLASLSIAAFMLRLVCTNGMINKTEVSASYRHVSTKILSELPGVFGNVSHELGRQKEQVRLSLESKVNSPESTIMSFNSQFQLNKPEKEAVDWALPQEYGHTMFNIVNIYTKAAQYRELPAESSHRLQKVGGTILAMVK